MWTRAGVRELKALYKIFSQSRNVFFLKKNKLLFLIS